LVEGFSDNPLPWEIRVYTILGSPSADYAKVGYDWSYIDGVEGGIGALSFEAVRSAYASLNSRSSGERISESGITELSSAFISDAYYQSGLIYDKLTDTLTTLKNAFLPDFPSKMISATSFSADFMGRIRSDASMPHPILEPVVIDIDWRPSFEGLQATNATLYMDYLLTEELRHFSLCKRLMRIGQGAQKCLDR